ncbi:MAG: AI-2E family transporter [Chloroflexota bacterium]
MTAHEDTTPLPSGAKLTLLIAITLLAVIFLWQVRDILSPFLWALFAAYLLNPIVNYLHYEGHLPRLWAVILIYLSLALVILTVSRYLYPQLVDQGTLFLEDIPRLEGSLVNMVGTQPLGINIDGLIKEIVRAARGYPGGSTASHLLVNALGALLKLFLFLVSTFYLLMDAPRLRRTFREWLPDPLRPELLALAKQINLTWQQYIRGELLLFVIMATATTIGLTILGVPGAIFLGLLSGVLELLPLVGPYTAGALAVSVGYFNGTNPFGWSQVAYGVTIAIMYTVLRQMEDYFVAPNVLGRAVRLHPLVVLFALTTGGVLAGLFGLLVAVPIAASLKAAFSYLYSKMLDQPVRFEPVRTLGGGVIEIPIHAPDDLAPETPQPVGSSPT